GRGQRRRRDGEGAGGEGEGVVGRSQAAGADGDGVSPGRAAGLSGGGQVPGARHPASGQILAVDEPVVAGRQRGVGGAARAGGVGRHGQRCPVHGERNAGGGAGVVGGVGGGEGHRERVGAGAQDGAGGRTVREGAGHVGRGVELGVAQGGAVDDG